MARTTRRLASKRKGIARAIIFLVAAMGLPFSAHALKAPAGAFRIENRKDGSLLIGSAGAEIESGERYRTVLLLWGPLDVYGTADEVLVLSGHAVFHSGARINNSLVVMGGSYEARPGAAVAAENVVFRAPGPWWRLLQSVIKGVSENFSRAMVWLLGLVGVLLFWSFAFVLFRLFPGLRRILVEPLWADKSRNLLAGIMGMMAAPILFSLLLISIFGILLLPLYFLLLFSAAAISYAAAAIWAGHRILPPRQPGELRGWSVLLGILAFQLLWTCGPWWGVAPVLLMWAIAWGALIRSLPALWRRA